MEDPALAVVLLDVVLGHGSAQDPAGRLAPVCAELITAGDPQRHSAQRAVLEQAGCIVPETDARAAGAAAALALRRPQLAEETP